MEENIKDWVDYLRWNLDYIQNYLMHNYNILITIYGFLIGSILLFVASLITTQWIYIVLGVIGIVIAIIFAYTIDNVNKKLSAEEKEFQILLNLIMLDKIRDIQKIKFIFYKIAEKYKPD